MAKIVINEISQNYTYNAGTSNFCTVAIPITACWGPAYEDPATLGTTKDVELENTSWVHFPATQAGLQAFVSTFRGPAANYRSAGDYSYQEAMTLLTAGYDLDVCRLCPGTRAQATLTDSVSSKTLTIRAKHPGSFGNMLQVQLFNVTGKTYWNMIVSVVDTMNVATAVENMVFVFDINDSTDTILHISEIESNYVDLITSGSISDSADFGTTLVRLGQTAGTEGSDRAADGAVEQMLADAVSYATARYGAATGQYVQALAGIVPADTDVATASKLKYMEWLYTSAIDVYNLLKDKLSYAPNRIISPWDDQNVTAISGEEVLNLTEISPIHTAIMTVAANSRCAAGLIDIPKCLPRSAVYNESTSAAQEGYAQRLARSLIMVNDSATLGTSHSALFAPWAQYTYVGTSKQNPASPSFIALLIERAMLLNQSLQYEWLQPSSRQHNVPVGKLDYTVPKSLLDVWQKDDGVGVNVIVNIPELGTCIWGNSTLFELPPATQQALADYSTRKLVNAIENVIYKVGIAITFQYNNQEAYSKFYAGVTPILDSAKYAGAIDDYRVEMSADIDVEGTVKARSVIGKVYLVVNGVISNITCDLIALPQGTDLATYLA